MKPAWFRRGLGLACFWFPAPSGQGSSFACWVTPVTCFTLGEIFSGHLDEEITFSQCENTPALPARSGTGVCCKPDCRSLVQITAEEKLHRCASVWSPTRTKNDTSCRMVSTRWTRAKWRPTLRIVTRRRTREPAQVFFCGNRDFKLSLLILSWPTLTWGARMFAVTWQLPSLSLAVMVPLRKILM